MAVELASVDFGAGGPAGLVIEPVEDEARCANGSMFGYFR